MPYIPAITVTNVVPNVNPAYMDVTVYCDPSEYTLQWDLFRVYGMQLNGQWQTLTVYNVTFPAPGTYVLQVRSDVATNDIVTLLSNPLAAYAKMGFWITGRAYGAPNKPGIEPWLTSNFMIDGLGCHPYDGLQLLRNMTFDYVAKVYHGISFPGLDGPSAIPDWTDVYVNDLYEERTVESGAGSIANPLYNAYEAITLASMISVAYEVGGVPRQVTVHVDGGEYEIMQASWPVVPGCDVKVVGDPSSTPFVYNNEDFNYAILAPYGGIKVTSQYAPNVSGSIWPDRKTSVRFEGMNLRGLKLRGCYGYLGFVNCDLQLCAIGETTNDPVSITHELELLDCYTSDCKWNVKGPALFNNLSSLLNRVDRSDQTLSQYWWMLKKFAMPQDSTLWNSVVSYNPTYNDPPAVQIANQLGAITDDCMAKVFNPSGTRAFHPDQATYAVIPVLRFDYYTNPWEWFWKNSYLGAFDPRQTTFNIRRNNFRDTSTPIRFNNSNGKTYFTNNIGTVNAYVDGGPVLVVDNNTFNAVTIYTTQTEWDATWGEASDPETKFAEVGNQVRFGSWCPDIIQISGLTNTVKMDAGFTYAADKEFSSELLDPYAAVGRQVSCQNNIGTVNLSTNFAASYFLTLHNILYFWWQWFQLAGYTSNSPVYSSSYSNIGFVVNRVQEPVSGYNQASAQSSEFVDTVLFFPTPTSALLDVGNPDPAYNDPDGTVNDVGAYGGPESATQVKAVIRWVESFVNVNYVQLSVGSLVRMDGSKSRHSPQNALTYTWSENPANPASVQFTNNGTADGAVQDVTFTAAGAYEYTLLVSDGVGSDSETINFVVQPSRTYCVDPSKAFTNDVVGGVDALSWTHTKYPNTVTIDSFMEDVSLDTGVESALRFDWLLNKTVPVAPSTRYYLKVKVAQQHKMNVNNTLSIGVLVMDATDSTVLLHDVMNIKGSGLLNFNRNLMESRTYGVGSCYFMTGPGASDVIIHVYEQPYNLYKETHLVQCWLAPADELVDAIYQDARLAVRHHAVGDQVQLAGNAYIDVPIRVAGKKVHFNIVGGWDPSSHDGSRYTVHNPALFPTYLNYLRFAWFNRRQREWSYHAVDMFLPVYFDSQLTDIQVVNLNPDLPNSYDYRGMHIYLTQHATVTFDNVKLKGLTSAGYIRSNVDYATPHDMSVLNFDVEDCANGLYIATNNIDVTIQGNAFRRVQNWALMAWCRNTPRTIDAIDLQKHLITYNTFEDCARPNVLVPAGLTKDQVINRMMSDHTLVAHAWPTAEDFSSVASGEDNANIGGMSNVPVLLWYSDPASYEVSHNQFTTVGQDLPSVAGVGLTCVTDRSSVGGEGQGLHLHLHDNVVGAGVMNTLLAYVGIGSPNRMKEFVDPQMSWILPYYVGYKGTFVSTQEMVAALLGTVGLAHRGYTIVEDNTLQGMRSVVEYWNDTGGCAFGVPHVVRNNALTDVYSLFWCSPYLLVDKAYYDQVAGANTWVLEQGQGESRATHFVWNLGSAGNKSWMKELFSKGFIPLPGELAFHNKRLTE